MKIDSRSDYRRRRHLRVRQKVKGTAERPRMSVFVSNRQMYVQFVDDDAEKTLAAVSTLSEEMKSVAGKKTVEVAKQLGGAAAAAALKQGVKAVVFDRGGFPYRGRVKALAEAAREAGLKF
jgi:large subunit ribosomal protein L18